MGLILEGVGYTYSAGTNFSERALEGVTLTCGRGDLVLVLGATGSGKSTLMRVAAGLLPTGDGSASVDGEVLTRASARGVVGLVFQDAESQLFAETVADDVAFGPRNLGAATSDALAAAREALTLVGLDPDTYGGRSPFSLSGGEARRAAIAGVLAMRPRYLLLDEPTAGLDSHGRRAGREIVEAMRESAGVVIVSHTAEEFLDRANQVLVLAGGSVAFQGSGADIVSDPSLLDVGGLQPPDVLLAQQLARTRGYDVGEFSLDPHQAAENLARAGGWL